MLSNDTSTFLRAFPRRRAWRENYRYNYKRTHLTSYGTKGVVITLWNLTKKYENALKQLDILPVNEAEIDRKEVANAYRVLESPWERNLDGRFYQTLATMQHHRDSQLVAPEITPDEWIFYFANEVKRRATPLLFLIRPERSVPHFCLPREDTPVTINTPLSPKDQRTMKKYRVPFRDVSIDILDSCRDTLIMQLNGKRFKYSELSEQLTNWELDLLSQMIRDEVLPATFDKTTVSFRKAPQSHQAEPTFTAVAILVKKYEEVGRS